MTTQQPQNKTQGKGNVQAINYFVAQKYVDAVAKLATAPNQRVSPVKRYLSSMR